MTDKIARFLANRCPETPCLVVDLDVIADSYRKLRKLLPLAHWWLCNDGKRPFWQCRRKPGPGRSF